MLALNSLRQVGNNKYNKYFVLHMTVSLRKKNHKKFQYCSLGVSYFVQFIKYVMFQEK